VPRRPTEFKTSLAEQKTEGHSNTTVVVTSITTRDNNTLSGDILGDTIVLTINPGASNSESVLCTGLTVATKTFTAQMITLYLLAIYLSKFLDLTKEDIKHRDEVKETME